MCARLGKRDQPYRRVVLLPLGIRRVAHRVRVGARQCLLDIASSNHHFVVEFSKPTRERATDHTRPKNTDPHLLLLSPVTPPRRYRASIEAPQAVESTAATSRNASLTTARRSLGPPYAGAAIDAPGDQCRGVRQSASRHLAAAQP